MNSRIVVVYHSADFDGVFSREIARQHFGGEAEYIGWDYGDPVPEVGPSDNLYLIDISIDALMTHSNLVWIDHHKTAIEKYPDAAAVGFCIDGVAACRLAWNFLNEASNMPCIKEDFVERRVTEPLAVRLAGEWDVWDKRDARAEVFQFGLKSCSIGGYWHSLLKMDHHGETAVNYILSLGTGSKLCAENENASIMAASAFDMGFEGLTFLALNTARCNSLTFESGVKPHHDGLLGFRFNGKQWIVSLYGVPSKPDVDLSVIAAKYGGGGHKQACGFQVKTLPFATVGG